MSPLEAKAYGLIDHIVGGDDAVFQVQGSTRAFPKTKEQYVNWGDEDLLDGSRGSRWGRGLVMWGGGVGWGGSEWQGDVWVLSPSLAISRPPPSPRLHTAPPLPQDYCGMVRALDNGDGDVFATRVRA